MSIFDRSDEKEYNEDPISSFSTSDLVAELERRDAWVETYIISKEEYFNDCSFILHVNRENIPSRVIVVRDTE